MQIGMIDVDGRGYPNIALMKLTRWHREQGDTVEWYSPFATRYDRVYMSKIFNFTPDYGYFITNCDDIRKGGTGYGMDNYLPNEVDSIQPDYSLYPTIDNKTAYGFLTRGCPNKCKWCVVPKKEGAIRPYMDVEQIAIEGRTHLILFDNNILALKDYAIEQLKKIIDKGYRVDFNQALDARLVDEELAFYLSRVKWLERRIRFGCDTHAQIKECERAMSLINGNGYKGEYFLYTMLNDNFRECYERTHYWWVRNHELRAKRAPGVYPHAQPYRDPIKRNDPPQWQKDMAGWVNKRMVFEKVQFKDFEPRKGFKCEEYLL